MCDTFSSKEMRFPCVVLMNDKCCKYHHLFTIKIVNVGIYITNIKSCQMKLNNEYLKYLYTYGLCFLEKDPTIYTKKKHHWESRDIFS